MAIELKTDLQDTLRFQTVLLRRVARVPERTAIWLRTYLRQRHLTGGPSRDRVGVRSGRLRRDIRIVRGNEGVASLHFATPYAGVHISERPRRSSKTKARTRIHLASIIRQVERQIGEVTRKSIERR